MKKGFFILTCFTSYFCFSQEEIDTIQLSEISVTRDAPVTKEILNAEFIAENNTAQDVPFLIENTTSAVATSDAGNGVGYSGIRVRGTDATRILVSIDGVPINDSESQSVFWVNMPNVAATMSSIEVQRGVGSSSNGTANFGGSINLFNKDFEGKLAVNTQLAAGSFNTFKANAVIELPSMLQEKFFLKTRLSYINSDGYIDRASSRLFAYQIASKYVFNESTSLNFNYFGGQERTYQAWYGIDPITLENDRTFNYAGAIYDVDYNIVGYYPDQTDNYWQDHLQVHFLKKFNTQSRLKITGFFTHGRGYYQELAQFQNLEDYKIPLAENSDLVRRKWLKNNFYGLSTNYYLKRNNWKWEANITVSNYRGYHFGRVINSEYFPLSQSVEYYRNISDKMELSSYLKTIYKWGKLETYLDLQIRNVAYQAHTPTIGNSSIEDNPSFEYNWMFFNPKIGMNIPLYKSKLYTFFGVSNREPTRTDILNSTNNQIKAERLYNLELGYQKELEKVQFAANLYGMWYDNQLVLIGGLDNVGNPIRQNIGRSNRLGAEFEMNWQPISKLNIFGNATFSKNTNMDYAAFNEQNNFYTTKNTTIAYSPEVVSSFGVQFNFIKNLDIVWVNKYVGNQYITNSENDNLIIEDYLVSNLRFHYQLDLKKNPLHFDLQLNNIFNQKYSSNAYAYNGVPYYYPQAEFNFMSGIRYEF